MSKKNCMNSCENSRNFNQEDGTLNQFIDIAEQQSYSFLESTSAFFISGAAISSDVSVDNRSIGLIMYNAPDKETIADIK